MKTSKAINVNLKTLFSSVKTPPLIRTEDELKQKIALLEVLSVIESPAFLCEPDHTCVWCCAFIQCDMFFVKRRWVTLKSRWRWWRPVKTVRSIPWTDSTTPCTVKYSRWTCTPMSSRSGVCHSHLGNRPCSIWPININSVDWVFNVREKLQWSRVATLASSGRGERVTRQRAAHVNIDGE